MTYTEFLGIVLVPPIVVLLLLEHGRSTRRLLSWQLPLIVLLAIVYTAPWDRQLIVDHVWNYPRSRVLGATVLSVPLEEYGFYVLQVILVGLVAAALWRRLEPREG